MSNELTTTSILSLFETTKEQRESFVLDIVNRLDGGDVDPMLVHLQVKCMEDMIKLITSNKNYKESVLEASQRMGEKQFQFRNAKFEIREVGTKYDYSKCNDPFYEKTQRLVEEYTTVLKQREKFLQTLPQSGLVVTDEETGEIYTIYPPSKTSSTSVVVTLK